MFGAPNRTAYDLNFSVLGIPVRVHPLFWLVAAVFGLMMGGNDGLNMLVFIVVMFVSILVHELGHAFTMRYYGHNPSIVLYGGGGLAMYQSMDSPWSSFGSNYSRRDTPMSKIIISAAGPAAGFALAGIVILYVIVGGLSYSMLGVPIGSGDPISTLEPLLVSLIVFTLFVNIFWGLLNLLPIYPLDGGQIARELFLMFSPYQGVRQSLWLSLITAAGMGLLAFLQLGLMFLGIWFLFFAVMNWQMLQMSGGGGGFGGGYGGGRPW